MGLSNAERQRRYRERKRQQKLSEGSGVIGGTDVSTPAVEGSVVGADSTAGAEEAEEGITVTVNTPEQPARPVSLKERLFGQKQGIQPIKKPAKPARSGKKKDVTIVSTVFPTMLAGLIVTFARDRMPEVYRPCAPTHQEATAILKPLFEELARYVEVTGKISETMLNLLNSLIAAMAYGARAYVTYVEIKHDIEKGQARHEQATQQQARGFPSDYYQNLDEGGNYISNRGSEAPVSGTGRPGNDGANGEQPGGGNDISDRAVDGAGPSGDARSDADRVADLFRRDRQGRVKLGLLAS